MQPYTRLASSTLFPLHERLKGHETCRILHELERSQWLTGEALRADQGRRLARFMTAVSTQVPFYRDLFLARGMVADDFRDPAQLCNLPIADKTLIRENFERLRADGALGLIRQRTSGSSGEPLHFLLGKHRISFDIAAKWRATRWWDVDIGDREMVLWGSAIENSHQDRLRRLRDALMRSRLIPTYAMTAARMDNILADMRAFRPRMLFGYPSALARLAFHAQAKGMPMDDLGIRVAFCTSEVLRPEWRTAIGSVFGCGVANEYGARDAGFIARECPAGGLHVTAEELIVEAVDAQGNAVPDGVEGDLLVTNMAGPEFPFIRYRTGDRGAISHRACACGRGLPLIERIAGRANDGLMSEDGGWVHGSAVNHLMRDIPGLRAYQLVQDTRDHVRVLLELEEALPANFDGDLSGRMRKVLGDSMRITLARVDEIKPLPNGKFRHIICAIDTSPTAASSREDTHS